MPDAGGASTGYLISEGDFKLLLDCGTGVFAKLRTHCEPTDIDAVLITHLHADHIADLLPFGHALAFVYREFGHRPQLLAPPGSIAKFNAITELFGVGYQIENAFLVDEYDPGKPARVGPLAIRYQPVPHYVPTWACELTSPSGARFTFGADCAPNDELPAFARGTDLIMLEATEGTIPHISPDDLRGHLTAYEAGQLARAAEAKRLVLTHFSDLLDPEQVRSQGRAGFGGPVDLAQDGAHFIV